jgi:hypothetical protein
MTIRVIVLNLDDEDDGDTRELIVRKGVIETHQDAADYRSARATGTDVTAERTAREDTKHDHGYTYAAA